jgi:hypothetical protein
VQPVRQLRNVFRKHALNNTERIITSSCLSIESIAIKVSAPETPDAEYGTVRKWLAFAASIA